LIENGADFSAQDKEGKNCLFWARKNGNKELIALIESKSKFTN